MDIKQELLENCDKGIKRNKFAIKINCFFAGMNLFFGFLHFNGGNNAMLIFHLVIIVLHVGLAQGASSLRKKWEAMKEDLTNGHF